LAPASLFALFPVFAIECRRWERNLKIQTILALALASLVFGCGSQLSSDEAGRLDAVAFVTGGEQEGAIPQGFETRWRRTVREREIEYQSIGPNAGFGQANDPHRDSRHVRIGVTITSPTKCVFKTVVTTEYSRGASRESFGDATSEVATLDFNKVRRFDIEDGDSLNVVIEGMGWMCKQGGCQDIVKIGFGAPTGRGARDREQAARHRLHQEGLSGTASLGESVRRSAGRRGADTEEKARAAEPGVSAMTDEQL
jgi:hypothetical protein